MGESAPGPGSDQTDQGYSSAYRADQCQQKGAGGLQLMEFFALEGGLVA